MDEDFNRTLAELLENFKSKSKLYDLFPFEITKPVNPALADLFKYKITGGGEPKPPRFEVMSDFLYHGTSLAALDMILEIGRAHV